MTVSSIVLKSFLSDIEQIDEQCSTILSTTTAESRNNVPTETELTNFADDLGKVLYASCTKLAIASKPPLCTPTVEACILSLQKELPAIFALCRPLRSDVHGEALCERIRSLAKRTLLGLSTLVQAVCTTGAEDRLGRTGVVWQACQELRRLPSNVTLISSDIQNSKEMLDDAIDELQSWLLGDVEEDDDSSNSSARDENLYSSPETVHEPSVRKSAKETEQRIVMLKRIQLLLQAMKKHAAKATLSVEQSNSIYHLLKPLVAEVDDLAGEIQEQSDEALIQELEKAVMIRVDELSHVMTRDVKDEKWLAWINTFRRNWLVASKSSTSQTGISVKHYSFPPAYSIFLEDHLKPLIPCTIDGLAGCWPCMQTWRKGIEASRSTPDFDNLREAFGSASINVTQCDSSVITTSFETFLHNVENNEYGYARDMHFKREFPSRHFYSCPELFQDDWLNFKLEQEGIDDYKFVYMGSSGTRTKLHRDVVASHSWSTNITGCKTWTLIPPHATQYIFNAKHDQVDDILDDAFLENWPNLALARASAITVLQHPGETIFVPSNWYHQVQNHGTTISINHNWINAVSLRPVYENLKHEMHLSAAAIVDLKRDGVVSEEGFVRVVQELTLANAGMNWQTLFDLIRFRLEREDVYINPAIRPDTAFEARMIREICSDWKGLDDCRHLPETLRTVDEIEEHIMRQERGAECARGEV